MITKEQENSRMCLFCASDFHLEMILLPYIQEKIDASKITIMTKDNLELTIDKLLDRVNIKKEIKEKIWKLNWKEKEINEIKNFINNKKENIIIINGDYDYIKNSNNYIKRNINKKLTIIDCFHVGDINVNIDEISKEYEYILNTKKI